MKYKSGDVGFIMHHDNPISKVIAWFMGSKWSHSFLVLEQTESRTYILETSDFEVCISTIDKYIADKNVTMEVWRRTDAGTSAEKAMPLLGEVYGYPQLLSLGLRRLLMRIGIHIQNFFHVSVVCCGVPLTGYQWLFGIDPKSIDTQEFYELISRYGFFRV